MKKFLYFTAIFTFASFLNTVCAQPCASCTETVSRIDALTYTINAGETFCLDSNSMFIGSITLNGGTICSKGIFSPVSIAISTGTISNYGNMHLPLLNELGTGISINNSKGILIFKGTLTMNGASVSNDGILNVEQTIQFNSGSFTNNSIASCTQVLGAGIVAGKSIISKNH